MHFEIFEELIHEQLKTNELKKTDENYFRFNEYSNLLFEELISSEKFLPELSTIKDISKEFLTSQYNDLNTNFVFYNPKNPEIFESFFMSTADNTSSAFDLNDLSEFQEASNFISEDMDFSMVGDYRLMSNTSFTSTDTQYKPDEKGDKWEKIGEKEFSNSSEIAFIVQNNDGVVLTANIFDIILWKGK